MKLAIFGASGGTGKHLVRQALSRDHDVIAVVRRPNALALKDEHLSVRQGDVLDADSTSQAIEDSEAVVSALGVGAQRAPTTIYSEGISNIIAALACTGTSRLIAISAAPAGPWREASAFDRRITYPILQRFFGASYDDMRRMEQILTQSKADWTIFRPPRLINQAAKGAYRTSTSGVLPHANTITRSDLATAILDAITENSMIRRAVAIAN